MNELCALAAAIEVGNAPFPPFTGKLIQHAPESFDDGRAAQIAVTVRTMRQTGEPVNFAAVGEKHLPFLNFVSELANSALPIDSAEYEAEKCWQTFQVRRAKSIGGELIQSLESSPKLAPSIIAAARSALDAVTTVATTGFTIRTPDEILAMRFDDSDRMLGDHLLDEGGQLALLGAGGVGKSRLLLLLLACIASARRFLTFDTFKPGMKWLVLQTENSNRRLQHDFTPLKAWLGDEWPSFTERVIIHTIETDCDAFVNLDDLDAVARIEAAIQKHKPDGIAIDPLADFAAGDLNKDADMKNTLQMLSRVCRRGNPKRAIIVLHHAITGRGGAMKATGYDRASFARNSKMLHAWARGQINLAPVDPDSNDRLIVACGKCSNGREFPTFAVRLNPDTLIYECDPTVDVSQWEQEITGAKDNTPLMNPDRVRELCAVAGSSKAELAKSITDDCGCYRGSAYRYITRAEQSKKIAFNKSHETYFRK